MSVMSSGTPVSVSCLTPQAVAALTELLGTEGIIADCGEPYDRDSSNYVIAPELVVLPACVEEVQGIMRLANEHRFAVTPRGAGTGTSGGCLAERGGVVLSLERMDRILSVDTENLVAVVEAGVITKDLRDAAAKVGLFFPPDPASLAESTLGGNVATNAGGPACVKYGVTRDYVLGLEAVTPTGELISAGVQTRKGVVGYDMAHLLCGSEGTLGIITKLIFKLIPQPKATVGCAAVFESIASAMQAVTGILTAGHLPSALEFLDHKCLALVGDALPFEVPWDKASLLIIELDGAPAQIEPEIEDIITLCRNMGATHIMPGGTAEERDRIWAVRRETSTRIKNSAPVTISEDVAVPIGRIAPFVETLPAFEAEYALDIYTFGHSGDGNIHLIITAPECGGKHRVEEGILAIVRQVLAMGGTISGEHGIGIAKRHLLPLELSAESVRLQKGIRDLFDPNGIMNPGKVFE